MLIHHNLWLQVMELENKLKLQRCNTESQLLHEKVLSCFFDKMKKFFLLLVKADNYYFV